MLNAEILTMKSVIRGRGGGHVTSQWREPILSILSTLAYDLEIVRAGSSEEHSTWILQILDLDCVNNQHTCRRGPFWSTFISDCNGIAVVNAFMSGVYEQCARHRHVEPACQEHGPEARQCT